MTVDQAKKANSYLGKLFGAEEGPLPIPESERRQKAALFAVDQLKKTFQLLESLKDKADLPEQYQEAVEIIEEAIRGNPLEWSSTTLTDEQLDQLLEGRKFTSSESLSSKVRNLATIIEHIALTTVTKIKNKQYLESKNTY